MNKLDFVISPADSSLLYQEDKSGTCTIIIYVDDMLVIGNKEIIQELKTKVEKVFSIKTEDSLTDHLGYKIHTNKKNERLVRTTIKYQEFGEVM